MGHRFEAQPSLPCGPRGVHLPVTRRQMRRMEKKRKEKKENLIFFPDGLRKRDGMARSAHLLKSMIFACFESSRSKFR